VPPCSSRPATPSMPSAIRPAVLGGCRHPPAPAHRDAGHRHRAAAHQPRLPQRHARPALLAGVRFSARPLRTRVCT
jgi:hypothetical protein